MSIAVVIAAKDASATIARAIRSALAEPDVTQVIVVDDGSHDDTAAVSTAADDGSGRLLVERLPVNRGPSVARNRALELAEAEYTAILDADDLIVPGRFAQLLAIPDWDLIADDILFVADGTDLDALAVPVDFRSTHVLDIAAFIDGCTAQPGNLRSQLGFLKPVIRRALLNEHDLRYDERVRLGEDFLLYLELLRRGARFILTDSIGYIAVERSNSLSARHTTADLEALLHGEQVLLAALPAGSAARRAMERRVEETAAKHALRAFLHTKRRKGFLAALTWLGRHPRHWKSVTTGISRDKLGAIRARFQFRPVAPVAPRRLLVGRLDGG